MNRIYIVFLLFIFAQSRPKDVTNEKVKQDIETMGDMILETLVVPSQRIGFCHYIPYIFLNTVLYQLIETVLLTGSKGRRLAFDNETFRK